MTIARLASELLRSQNITHAVGRIQRRMLTEPGLDTPAKRQKLAAALERARCSSEHFAAFVQRLPAANDERETLP